MKQFCVLSVFIIITFYSRGQFTQIQSGSFTGFPYTQSQDSGLNPSLCDTLEYVFRHFTDSLKVNRQPGTSTYNDSGSRATVYSVNRIDSLKDNLTGTRFVYFIQYQSGNDSAWMFNVFTNVIAKVKECLLSDIVKTADGFLIHDPEYSRKLRYEYVIKEVKDNIDPVLTNSIITVEFFPDTRGIISDRFVLYRVNIVVHP